MDVTLSGGVSERLEVNPPAASAARSLVEASLSATPAEAIAAVLAGGEPPPLAPAAAATAEAPVPRSITLSEIVVEGFRGIGPEAVLELDPSPGLTLVVGRNGSGKSSFAEGLELLLTGDSFRWLKRTKVWKDGWRNVHSEGARRVEARFCEDGVPGESTLRRQWPVDATDVAAAPLEALGPDRLAAPPPAALELIDTYRPILSYSELGSMLDEGPSKLYDALATVLGLDDLAAASAALAAARKALAAEDKLVKAKMVALRSSLEAVDDDRARQAVQLLDAKTADLDAMGELATGDSAPIGATDAVTRARQLAEMSPIDIDRFVGVAGEVREAAKAWDATSATDAGRADRTASLLRQALDFHHHAGDGDCPVCGRQAALGDQWRVDTEAEVERLEAAAASARQARTRLDRAVGDLAVFLDAPSALLDSEVDLPVDATDARAAWAAVLACPSPHADPVAAADHLAGSLPPAASALADISERARAWWQDHLDRWRPHAEELAAWVVEARAVADVKAQTKHLKAAEDWLNAATLEIQAERFAPTADHARRLWDTMRCASNVAIEDVILAGTSTRRRVDIEVSVDGAAGAALGVMSQGELNTLALALFLPRAMLDASPFKFIVIDDPVQSMDPARVDGLARVLEETARTHQVVVFTHDDRLPESVRRMQIPAKVIRVQRRKGSLVETSVSSDPVKVYLGDAGHIRKMRSMPSDVASTVVPALYREAIEAATLDVLRRRWTAKGRDRASVERTLANCELVTLMSYLVLDRRVNEKTEVYQAIGDRFGVAVSDTISTCNRAAHDGYSGDLEQLGRSVQQVIDAVRATR